MDKIRNLKYKLKWYYLNNSQEKNFLSQKNKNWSPKNIKLIAEIIKVM